MQPCSRLAAQESMFRLNLSNNYEIKVPIHNVSEDLWEQGKYTAQALGMKCSTLLKFSVPKFAPTKA